MDNMVYESLSTYFTRLKSIGYMPYKNVDSLLVLLYIYYMKENYVLDETEQRIVRNALDCIEGSNCVIPDN